MATKKPEEHTSGLSMGLGVGGVGAGLYLGSKSMFPAIPTLPRTSSVDSALRAVADTMKIADRTDREQLINFLNNSMSHISDSKQKAAILKSAFQQAVNSSDPAIAKHLGKLAQTLVSMPDEGVQNAIESIMLTRANRTTLGVFNNFQQNVNMLSKHLKVTGEVPNIKQVGSMKPFMQPTAVPKGIQSRVENIARMLGSNTPIKTPQFFTSPGFAAEGLGTFRFGIHAMGRTIDLDVPLANKGMMVRGITPRSRFIAPPALVVDPTSNVTERLERHELFLQEIEDSLANQKGGVRSPRAFKRVVSRAKQKVFNLEAVSALPRAIKPSAEQLYEYTRSSQIDVVMRSGGTSRKPTENELVSVMKAHQLYGGTSPSDIAMGRVQEKNLAAMRFSPSFISWDRRVEAGFRQWGLTPRSLGVLNRDPRYQRWANLYTTPEVKAAGGQGVNAHLRVLYADFDDPNIRRLLGDKAGEGQVLARRYLGKKLEFETSHTKRLTEVDEKVIEALRADPKSFQPKVGQVIGRTEEGKLLQFEKNMRIIDASIGAHDVERGLVSLTYAESEKFGNVGKLFGDLKHTASFVEEAEMNRLERAITRQDMIDKGFDIIANINDLRKNQGLLTKQMMTGYSEVLSLRNAGVGDPIAISRGIERIAADRAAQKVDGLSALGHFTDMLMQKASTDIGKSRPMFLGEFAHVFGGAYAAADDKASSLFTKSQFEGMAQKHFGGRASWYLDYLKGGSAYSSGVLEAAYAGSGYESVTKMATIEPRMFEILDNPTLKQHANLVEDFASRVALGEPGKLAVHQELSKTLSSMVGKGVAGAKGMSRFNLGEAALRGSALPDFASFVESGGGMLDIGKGFAPMYVPGADVIRPMRGYKSGGQNMMGQLERDFEDIVESASRMYTGTNTLSPDEFRNELGAFQNQMVKHWAPTGKGMGGFLRGEMVGTRALIGTSAVQTKAGLVTAASLGGDLGISTSAGLNMINELKKTGRYSDTGIEEMRERFMSGNTIAAGTWRHPIIGEYSTQIVGVKRVRGMIDQAQVLIPEINQEVNVSAGMSSKPISLRLGPLVGLSGDKDADTYVLGMLAPDHEKALRHSVMQANSAYMEEYAQHQVKYQILKAKSAAAASQGDKSLSELVEASIRKLGTPERGLGALSNQLTEAKRAVRAAGESPYRANALGLLEWLEQTPISGKHLKHEQVLSGEFGSLLDTMTETFRRPNSESASTLQGLLEQMVEGNNDARAMLGSGLALDAGSAASLGRTLGTGSMNRVEGYNIQETLPYLMRTLSKFREDGGAAAAAILAGKQAPSTFELGQLLANHGAMGAKVSEASLEGINNLMAAGKGLLSTTHGKVGLGFAGALALSTLLSRPSAAVRTTPPEMPATVNRGQGAVDRMSPETVGTPRQMTQFPRTPSPFNSPRAIVSPQRSNNYGIDLDISHGVDTNAILGSIRQRFANANASIYDYRGINNPYKAGNEE